MCARFSLEAALAEIEALLSAMAEEGVSVPSGFVAPSVRSIVAVQEKDHRRLRSMQFAMIPSWSKERRPTFATYNARWDGLDTKPTWREPLRRKRCLVPITSFYEPIYTGALAGNMVQFESTDQIMVAAGLWDEWVDRTTGEVVKSFAIVTDDPLTFVGETGHDRSPIFLPESAWGPWLDPEKQNEAELKEFLRAKKYEPALSARAERPLKDGWQKNAPEGSPEAASATAKDDADPRQLTLSFD